VPGTRHSSKLCIFFVILFLSIELTDPDPEHCIKLLKLRKFGTGYGASTVPNSVADPDSGSSAFLTPGSGMGFFRISDGFQTHIFQSLVTNFWVKKLYNSVKTDKKIFLQHFKNKILFNFVKFVATKKGMTTHFFHPPLLLLFLDPGWVKIRIRDPV
jgi:hypothetical protein